MGIKIFIFSWNKLIGLSAGTMKKFLLNLSTSKDCKSWVENIEEVLSLTRKFREIHVRNLNGPQAVEEETEALVEVSARLGSLVRILHIDDVRMDKIDDFTDFLRNFPMLEKLKINKLTFAKCISDDPLEPVVLQCLTSLQVSTSDSTLFNYIIVPKLTSFDVQGYMKNCSEDVANFIKSTPKLESLKTDHFAFVRIVKQQAEYQTLKLKSLFVDSQFLQIFFRDKFEEEFCQFLKAQSDSLQQLRLVKFPIGTWKTIFPWLHSLKMLHIDFRELPTNKEFYMDLQPNKSLREIVATHEFPNLIAAEAILRKCPNLESFTRLSTWEETSELLPLLATYNRKLKKLIISTVKAQPVVQFKALTALNLSDVDDLSQVTSFIENNPSIEALTTGKLIDFNPDDFKALISQPNLKHLKFTGYEKFSEAKKIYDIVKVDCKKLKTLEIELKYLQQSERRFLKVELPGDFSRWNKYFEN